jgi:hypothetical protein
MKLSDVTPHIAECREALNGSNADAVKRRENVNASLLREREVTRTWRDLTPDLIPTYKAFLDFYTDAKNNTPQFWVDKPMVGQEELAPGRWRNAYVFESYEGDVPSISQTLRYGFIEKLVTNSTVDYSEARLVQVDLFNGDGATGESSTKEDYFVIQWKGVSPVKSAEIVQSLKELDYDSFDPVINGNAIGSVKRIFVKAVEDQDGSHTIRMMVANPTLVYESVQTWLTGASKGLKYYFNVPTNAAPAIIAFEKKEGVTIRLGSPSEGLLDITISEPDFDSSKLYSDFITSWNCRFKEYTTLHLGLSEEAMEEIELEEPPIGETHSLRRLFDGDSWTVEVRVQVRQKQVREDDLVGEDKYAKDYLSQYLGIDPTSEDMPAFVVADAQTKRRGIEILEDCTLNVRDQINQADTIAESQTMEVENTFESSGRNTTRNAATVRDVTAVKGAGKIVTQQVEKSEHKNRVHDTLEVREAITVEDAQTVETDNTFEKLDRDTIRNKSAAAREPVSADGVIQTVTVEKSEFPGRVHDTLEERASKVVEDAQTIETENTFEAMNRDTIRNKSGGGRVPVSADGVIQTVTVEKSEFPDRVHDTLEERVASTVTDAVKVERTTAFVEVVTDTVRNAEAAREPTAGDGEILEHRVEESEFPDRVHDTITRDKAKTNDGAGVESEKVKTITAFEEDKAVTTRNQGDAIEEQDEQVDGSVITTRSILNDHGKYDNTERTRDAIEQAGFSEVKFSSDGRDVEIVRDRNMSDELEAPVAEEGEQISAINTLNEYLKFDRELNTTTIKKLEEPQYTAENTKDQSVTDKSGIQLKTEDLSDYEIDGEDDDGVRSNVARARTQDGLHSASKRVLTLKPLGVLTYTVPSPYGNTDIRVGRNLPIDTLESTLGGLSETWEHSLSSLNHHDGVVDFVITSRQPRDGGGGTIEGFNDDDRTIYYKRDGVAVEQEMRYCNSSQKAMDFINGENMEGVGMNTVNLAGTEILYLGRGRWKAVRIRLTKTPSPAP